MLAQCCRLSRLLGGTPTPFWTTYVHSPALRINVRYAYWPPPANKRSRLIELPSGKKFFVFRGKRDADGKLEPVVCFIDRNGDRLTSLNSEELQQLQQLTQRLRTYFDLWQQKQ